MQTLLRIAAWLIVAVLAFVTLSPIGYRPALAPANIERACAYGALGLIFCLAYPRRWLAVIIGVVTLAAALELGQGLTSTRHGRVADFLVKGGGATAGVLFALAATMIVARRTRP